MREQPRSIVSVQIPFRASHVLAVPICLLWLLVLLAACGESDEGATGRTTSGATSENTATATPAEATPTPEPRTRFGVAGLVPANHPDPTDDDWAALFESYGETGDLVGAYVNWRDLDGAPGEVPAVIQVTFGFASDRDLTTVVAIGVKVDDGPGRIRGTVEWDDPSERQAFIDRVLQVVDEYEPEYLAIGVEVNRFWELLPEEFEAFAAAYAEAYDAVNVASPETLVFTVFQLEMLKGAAYLMGGREALGPQWEVVDHFAGRLDLIGLTTYPYFDYETPAAIPDDYYAELADRYPGLPIALTEIGWPSRPLSVAPDSPFGGTDEEQAAFVVRLGELTADIPLALALWSFPNDVGPTAGPSFESISLRENDGTPKPALAAWQALIAAR